MSYELLLDGAVAPTARCFNDKNITRLHVGLVSGVEFVNVAIGTLHIITAGFSIPATGCSEGGCVAV